MDFEKILMARESCRSYSDKPVSREQLLRIVEAGRMSPSGCNAQPWKFIVVDAPEVKEKLCDALVVDGAEASEPRKKARKPLEEVCSFNQW